MSINETALRAVEQTHLTPFILVESRRVEFRLLRGLAKAGDAHGCHHVHVVHHGENAEEDVVLKAADERDRHCQMTKPVSHQSSLDNYFSPLHRLSVTPYPGSIASSLI